MKKVMVTVGTGSFEELVEIASRWVTLFSFNTVPDGSLKIGTVSTTLII